MAGSGGRGHTARRARVAVHVPAAAHDAAPRPALHRGGSPSGSGPRRAAEPRRLDTSLRVGSGHRRLCHRAEQRAAHGGRGALRGVLLSQPRGGNLDALRDARLLDCSAGRRVGRLLARRLLQRLLRHRARPAPSGGLDRAGDYRGAHDSAAPRPGGPGRGKGCPRQRPSGGRRPGGLAAGRAGQRIPIGAPGADRGDRPRAADRLHQRGGTAARARGDAPAGARGLRGPRSGPGPARAPAPDREHDAEHGRRRARSHGGGGGAPGAARGGSRRRRATRRRRAQRRRTRVRPRPVGGRRARVRRRTGLPMVAVQPGASAERGERAGRRRLPPAPLEPGAGRAGGGPGGRRGRAAGGGRPSPAQLRRARHRRSRLRPHRRDHRAHPESGRASKRAPTGTAGRERRGRRPFPGGVPRGRDAPGASAGRGRGRGLVRPPARVRRHDDLDARAGRRPARTGRTRRPAELPGRVGQPRLLRRDAPASPRRASLHALRPHRGLRRGRGERDVSPRPLPRRAGRRTARAVRVRRPRRRGPLVGSDRSRRGRPVTRDSRSPGHRRKRSSPQIRPGRPARSARTPSSPCGPPGIPSP